MRHWSRATRGDSVQALQERLTQLGYLTDPYDGMYGSTTADCVSRFQTANGLEATGIADPATQAALFASGALREGRHPLARGKRGVLHLPEQQLHFGKQFLRFGEQRLGKLQPGLLCEQRFGELQPSLRLPVNRHLCRAIATEKQGVPCVLQGAPFCCPPAGKLWKMAPLQGKSPRV